MLSMRDALALALEHNPNLSALALEVEAREGTELQAGLLPNPQLSVDVENFGRSRKRLDQLNGPEYTLAIGQLVELGGKRAARVRVAGYDRRLSLWDYESARADLLARTARDFVAVLTSQEQAALARDGIRVSEETHAAVLAKIESGKVSPIEETRAMVLVARARLAADRAEGELASARARLAANWGGAHAGFEQAIGGLGEPDPLPELALLHQELGSHPDIARWEDEIHRREAELKLERANRIPDPTVVGGFRFLDETDETGFLAGVSLPLAVSDRNQGGVQAADRRLSQAKARQRAAIIDRRAALTVAFEGARSARHQVLVIKSEILPGADRALESTREAYRQGKLGLTDVLATERAWFETRAELLTALRDYHGHRAELETLAGRPLTEIATTEEKP